jgi:hypothetical protein
LIQQDRDYCIGWSALDIWTGRALNTDSTEEVIFLNARSALSSVSIRFYFAGSVNEAFGLRWFILST